MINIRKLEADLWESSDLLRAESKLTSNQYCMPVLELIFLRYAYSRFKMVEREIMANRPSRNGQVMPVSAIDFKGKSALYLPKEAQFDYLVDLPANVADLGLKSMKGDAMNSLGEVAGKTAATIATEASEAFKSKTDFIVDRKLSTTFYNDAVSAGGYQKGRAYAWRVRAVSSKEAKDNLSFADVIMKCTYSLDFNASKFVEKVSDHYIIPTYKTSSTTISKAFNGKSSIIFDVYSVSGDKQESYIYENGAFKNNEK